MLQLTHTFSTQPTVQVAHEQYWSGKYGKLASGWVPQVLHDRIELDRARGCCWQSVSDFVSCWDTLVLCNLEDSLHIRSVGGAWGSGSATGMDTQSFHCNPQFWLMCRTESRVSVTLVQQSSQVNPHAASVAVIQDGVVPNRVTTQNRPENVSLSSDKLVAALGISPADLMPRKARLTLNYVIPASREPYILVPYTSQPGQFATFDLIVTSEHKIDLGAYGTQVLSVINMAHGISVVEAQAGGQEGKPEQLDTATALEASAKVHDEEMTVDMLDSSQYRKTSEQLIGSTDGTEALIDEDLAASAELIRRSAQLLRSQQQTERLAELKQVAVADRQLLDCAGESESTTARGNSIIVAQLAGLAQRARLSEQQDLATAALELELASTQLSLKRSRAPKRLAEIARIILSEQHSAACTQLNKQLDHELSELVCKANVSGAVLPTRSAAQLEAWARSTVAQQQTADDPQFDGQVTAWHLEDLAQSARLEQMGVMEQQELMANRSALASNDNTVHIETRRECREQGLVQLHIKRVLAEAHMRVQMPEPQARIKRSAKEIVQAAADCLSCHSVVCVQILSSELPASVLQAEKIEQSAAHDLMLILRRLDSKQGSRGKQASGASQLLSRLVCIC